MIPINDHDWRRIDMDGEIPDDHYAECARTDHGEIVVRIVGPHAHVWGQDPYLSKAVEAALNWFSSVGGELLCPG